MCSLRVPLLASRLYGAGARSSGKLLVSTAAAGTPRAAEPQEVYRGSEAGLSREIRRIEMFTFTKTRLACYVGRSALAQTPGGKCTDRPTPLYCKPFGGTRLCTRGNAGEHAAHF